MTRDALAAGDGDPTATTAFIRSSQADVWRLCAHLVDAQTADDLTQETYLRAFRNISGFQGRSSARTWLLSIARRVCIDELRSRERRRRRDRLLRRITPTEHTDPDITTTVDVPKLLSRLDPHRRIAFVLTQMLGLPYAEAATVCDCPVGTIRSRVARARTDLIDLLAETEEPGIDEHHA